MMQMLSTTWSIRTSPVWAILLFLSYGHAEIYDFTKCDITDNFQTPYLSASLKSLQAGVGCESNANSSSGEEVHVITVIPPGFDDSDRRITVKLSIHSRRHANLRVTEGVDFQEQSRRLIFVLNSPCPVRWKVDMHGINSQEKHLFMLSKDSLIKFQGKRTKLMAKSRKPSIPYCKDNKDIYNWAKGRFKGVTSYSEVSDLNVKFYVGKDVNAGPQCNLKSLDESLRIFSIQEVARPISGCVSKGRRNVLAKPVYIVELLDTPNQSPGISGIDLEIQAYNDPSNGPWGRGSNHDFHNEISRDFSLVVKSPPHLKWTLHSRKMAGWVDIVADAEVKVTGVKLTTVALRAEVINATGMELIRWSQDFTAPVQMYVGIQGANTIKLRVPPPDKKLATPREKSTASSRDHGPARGWREGKDERPENMIKTTCDGQQMVVAISKGFIQMMGRERTKISLRDPSCGPTDETDDKIILRTELTKCGTHALNLVDKVSFSNAVVIQTPPGLVSSLLHDELGSGFFEEEAGSGSQDIGMFTDDEDLRSNPFSIAVECEVPMNKGSKVGKPGLNPLGNHQSTGPGHKCSMNLFLDFFFLRPRNDYPVTVAKDSSIYIQASLTGQESSLMVDKCWLSTSQQPDDSRAQTKTVLEHGCDQDNLIQWMDDPLESPASTQLHTTKFGIKVKDFFQGHSPIFVHCVFRECQKSSSPSGSKECPIDIKAHCRQRHALLPNLLPEPKCGPLTLGPLDLTDKEIHVKPTRGGSGTNLDKKPERSNQNHQQRVIIEGLDSATVVGIAFAAFAIGILLTAALWFIHSHTGPIKRGVANTREVDNNGDLTPNSSSPMTA